MMRAADLWLEVMNAGNSKCCNAVQQSLARIVLQGAKRPDNCGHIPFIELCNKRGRMIS